ncbi:hypothetical protein PPYR_08475 [Photinus pyralis]|uniref:Anoctamin n=2 Tax=Photinus pyralis TaxID=7054 RepID=A0A5N4AJF3_PHOPY|nr:hypothetical protein PPYR_08475 [Photinus pyralis]
MSRHRISEDREKQSVEISDEDNDGSLPQSYVVMRFDKNIPDATLEWIVDKIHTLRTNGGGELLVLKQPYKESEGVVLHISASTIKFLEAAEEMEIMKCDKNGVRREFTVSSLEDFLPDGMHVDDFLTTAEKQKIIKHELENIRALPVEGCIPGYPQYTLYEGQSILHVCLVEHLIKAIYPLHDVESLKKLGKRWYATLFDPQPLEEIRLYFGEAIALYFAFLGFYTAALVFPTFLGFLQLFVSHETVPFFCVFNVVWVTVLLELWRRRSNELAFQWGTIGMTSLDEPRGNFHGRMGKDAVTGRIQPQYPRWKTTAKLYFVSIPIVIACMLFASVFMLALFWVEDYMKDLGTPLAEQLMNLPSIIYSILVFIINVKYKTLATYLTNWENHRTASQFDRHRVIKLIMFEFVNTFMSLFYIAFVKQDLEILKTQLATMLIVQQAINNIQEVLIPLFIKKYTQRTQQNISVSKEVEDKCENINSREILKHIPEIRSDDTRIAEAEKEDLMDVYEETYDDYLEMYIQFGYVVLFSSVYPLAAFWAVVNNFVEIRSDAFKLCKFNRRPFSKKVKDIGAWQKAFEVVGGLSILTNCGLMFISFHQRKDAYFFDQLQWLVMFVALEHCLLGIRYLLHIAIQDKPEWVRVALAKKYHASKQALKNEQLLKNRGILARKFKTVSSRPFKS